MATCLDGAASYMEKQVQAVQTKKAIVVALFFTYCVYTVSLVGKHVLKHVASHHIAKAEADKTSQADKESHEKYLTW